MKIWNEVESWFKTESYILYGHYLVYCLDNYCKVNLRYRTIEEYLVIVNEYLKIY